MALDLPKSISTCDELVCQWEVVRTVLRKGCMHIASLPESLRNDKHHETGSRAMIEERTHLSLRGGRIRGVLTVLAAVLFVSLAFQAGAESRFASWARVRYDAILATFSDFGSDYLGRDFAEQSFRSRDGNGNEVLFPTAASQVQVNLFLHAGDSRRFSGVSESALLVRNTVRSGKWSVARGGLQIGPVQLGYGQLLAERSVLTQGWNGTSWEEPGYAFLRTKFSF